MRPRHWGTLREKIGAIIEYESDTFTLQEIFKIQLLSYQDAVKEVCEIAREEYKIESALANIEARWSELVVVVDEHKKGMYNIKKADEGKPIY